MKNPEGVAEAVMATTVAVCHLQYALNTPAVSVKLCFHGTIMLKYREPTLPINNIGRS